MIIIGTTVLLNFLGTFLRYPEGLLRLRGEVYMQVDIVLHLTIQFNCSNTVFNAKEAVAYTDLFRKFST
jgi:hypothetical protein